jgi:hypothetical protein
MNRRSFLSLCGLVAGSQAEHCPLPRASDRPGSSLTYVEAPDLATLACLQNRLNDLDENLAIERSGGGERRNGPIC